MLSLQELKSLNLKELIEELEKAKQAVVSIRIQCKTGHEKNTQKAKASRRYVARLKTMIKEVEKEKAGKGKNTEEKPKESKKKESK